MKRKKFDYSGLNELKHYEMEEEEQKYLIEHIIVETHAGLPYGEELKGYSLELIRDFHDRYEIARII